MGERCGRRWWWAGLGGLLVLLWGWGRLWAQTPGDQSPAEGSAGPVQPRGVPAWPVIEELLAARSKLGQLEAHFTWGSVAGPERRRTQGRFYLKDAERFLMQFAAGQTGVGAMQSRLVPDGRWIYEFAAGAPRGIRRDLAEIERRAGVLGPRVELDVTGGALLTVLRRRPDVVYEGDQEREVGLCRVLSHPGGSLRLPTPSVPPEDLQGGPVRTRVYFRKVDGLLAADEEVDAKGDVLSEYRLLEVKPLAAWPEGLLTVPQGVHFLDVTKQFTRRLLYGTPLGGVELGAEPQPAPGARPRPLRP